MSKFKNISVELKKTYNNGNRSIKVFSIMSEGINVWDLDNSNITTVGDLFYKL